ncbi:hypothetical protein B0F90DRAFT_1816395 [Multifurca ochricompacta]|uniref:Uncharacterized protein n=1 Tax=Multifurca ochricompacta TaxID=376703 RepID=A0AAD4M6A3_9AGAM|nr:hypothetical protein B0F90DRAFT_1816395 [Multifurca ochricompacta]
MEMEDGLKHLLIRGFGFIMNNQAGALVIYFPVPVSTALTAFLVDKIIIAQQSLQEFIDALSTDSSSSITNVDFKALDSIWLKPIGLYGSKEEIVRFLREINVADDKMDAEVILRSGLYAIRSFASTSDEQIYVLYWPEDTTWNDEAPPSVQRNRVMFMRYLTKLCDQLICLLSVEHLQGIVWRDDGDEEYDDYDDGVNLSSDSEHDDSDRLSHFQMNSSLLVEQHPPPGVHVDPKVLLPSLLHGEKVQGFMTAEFKPAKTVVEPFSLDHQTADQIRLRCGANGDDVLCLSNTIDDYFLKTLMDLGLKKRVEMHTKLDQDFEDIRVKLKDAVTNEVLTSFPSLRREVLFPETINSTSQGLDPLHDLLRINARAAQMIQDGIRAAHLDSSIDDPEFQFKKTRFYFLCGLLISEDTQNLEANEIEALVNAVLGSRDMQSTFSSLENFGKEDEVGGVFQSLKTWIGIGKAAKRSSGELWEKASNHASRVSDSKFLVRRSATGADDYLYDAAVDIEKTAYTCIARLIESLVSKISEQIYSTLKGECNKQVQRTFQSAIDKELETLRSNFVRQIEDLSRERSTSRATIYIDNFEMRRDHHHSPNSSLYSISGRHELLPEEEIKFHVHFLQLHPDQRHNLQQDPKLVPTPVVNERISGSFHVPPGTLVKYAHLLEEDRILLGLVNSQGNVMIYIESLARIDNVIQSQSFARLFHKDKIGETGIIAFDESKRMLAFYASARMQLHIFVFDEEFKSLRGMGSAINLAPFYTPGVSIIHACFIHGSEEILFVDSDAQARIFSLTMLQPKPASLQLPQIPHAIYSSPDGLCVLVVQEDEVSSMRAYHWSTFGSTDGILITPDDFPVDLGAALLTSIVNPNTIHLIGFDLNSRCCRSLILDIKREATEFSIQEQRSQASSSQAVHNCLIDCHVDVWTRFPVLPAVKRRATTTRGERQKALIFVTNDDRRPFSSYFSRIVSTFEKTSRKPTGDELSGISVSARTFPSFAHQFLSTNSDWSVSRFRAGEWLANLLCIVPIQIAIAHENRFVPLKDGVLSAQLQASLLDAGVDIIVDTVSFGWYELIFRCYWASKPVKVVSSLGEQSVGKSFALNHLVDSCFGPSTMGASDGVWMSACPSDDALIVALDFEGVSSRRRSAQENILLVLFNTAISNLVLFRNNFYLGEDSNSHGVFQFFKSSSFFLDPASNPSLFQSTLVVIIKDVIASDKAEVTKEFSHKFQKIVKEEQYSNFVTRLHAGNLKIIPWPVIESREFYRLFGTIKRMLGQQPTVHHTAGEFLYTLRILMAKLTAHDWGPISETMASHRANALLEILPNALETGFAETIPELELLKDFDTGQVIQAEDTSAQFFLPGPVVSLLERERRLTTLRESWDRINTRQHVDDSEWSSDLAQYLTHLADLRIVHVDKWVQSNMQRFKSGCATSNFVGRSAGHVACIAY